MKIEGIDNFFRGIEPCNTKIKANGLSELDFVLAYHAFSFRIMVTEQSCLHYSIKMANVIESYIAFSYIV